MNRIKRKKNKESKKCICFRKEMRQQSGQGTLRKNLDCSPHRKTPQDGITWRIHEGSGCKLRFPGSLTRLEEADEIIRDIGVYIIIIPNY